MKTKQELALKALAMIGEALETKNASGTPTYTELHGQGGIFSTPGLERDIVSAHIRPLGIATALPIFGTSDENPRFGALTGYTDVDATAEPTQPCADAPKGFVKACTLTARFGLTRRDTQEIDMLKTGLKVNRGDMTDLQLRGRLLGLSGLTPGNLNEQGVLNIVVKSEMVGAAVQAERRLSQQMWQGTWGAAGEFPGLDSQIATGIVDADENVACPALDSDVKDFTYNAVEGGGKSIVRYVAALEYYIYHVAFRTGMLPVNWVFAMRPELWQVLTEVWPCQYNTNRCSSAMEGTNSRLVIDGERMVAMRDSMRQTMTIEVNGRSYPVIVDDGIYEHDSTNDANLAAGEYASSIYFIPLTAQGGFPVLYREYLDYRSAVVGQNVAAMRGTEDFWSDDGIYSWAVTKYKWCTTFHLRTEQRVILRTPQLAGKIQNIKYTPLQHLRSPYPDSDYFKDGGVSLRNYSQSYSVWGVAQ